MGGLIHVLLVIAIIGLISLVVVPAAAFQLVAEALQVAGADNAILDEIVIRRIA